MKTSCIEYAIKYISRFPKTEKELRIQLQKKNYSESEIQETIDYMISQKFLDDEKFAQMYVYSQVAKKGKPIWQVQAKLISKGIDKGLVQKAIDAQEEEIQDWVDTKILKEIQKYKAKWLDWFTIIQKLANKWYNLQDIRRVLDKQENQS